MVSLEHRKQGYQLLSGKGLEIGALHEAAELPQTLEVSYFDVVSEHDASVLFPELDPQKLIHVDYIGDIDKRGLQQFREETFDFVVIMHVLEHVANPIGGILDVFRILKTGGHAVIAIPDKDYTFDRGRQLTSFDHLWEDYTHGVEQSDDSHYLDFWRSAAPHVFSEPEENLPIHVARARSRREHAHVWNGETFKRTIQNTLIISRVKSELVFESVAQNNLIEYFSVWKKL